MLLVSYFDRKKAIHSQEALQLFDDDDASAAHGVRDNKIFCTCKHGVYIIRIAARTLTQWPDGRRLRCERVGFQHRELFVTSGEKKHNKKITCCLNTCVDEK